MATMAVIVILLLTEDSDNDLQQKMLEAQAQMAEKQAIRTLTNEEETNAADQAAGLPPYYPWVPEEPVPASGVPEVAVPNYLNVPIVSNITPATLRTLLDTLTELTLTLNSSFFATSSEVKSRLLTDIEGLQTLLSSLTTPGHASQYSPQGYRPLTHMFCESIANGIAQLQNDLDSDNEVSQMTAMQLQMLLDIRNQLLQIGKSMEKSMSETNESIVGNLKG